VALHLYDTNMLTRHRRRSNVWMVGLPSFTSRGLVLGFESNVILPMKVMNPMSSNVILPMVLSVGKLILHAH